MIVPEEDAEKSSDVIIMNLSNAPLDSHNTAPQLVEPFQNAAVKPENMGNAEDVKPVQLYHLDDDSEVEFFEVPPEIITIDDSEDIFMHLIQPENTNDPEDVEEPLISVQTQPNCEVNFVQL